jgi:hypothetical protein
LSHNEKELFKTITPDDRYAFDVIDAVVNDLHNHFPKYNKEFIINALEGNSMNISDTYVYLKNPTESIFILI